MRTDARAETLSAAGLLYLFAHDVAPRDPAAADKTEVPCLGARIPTRPLAVQLVAGTLWDLERRGAVVLELSGARLSTRDVTVARAADVPLAGRLETALAGTLGPTPESVRAVLRGWVGSGPDAAPRVVEAARNDVVAAGLITRSGPRCRAIEARRDAFDDLLREWLRWRRVERETYDMVVAESRVLLGR